MTTSQEIRKQFKDFFESKNHQIVSSAPMVVKGDPTLMFTNAGMNQFKDCFLGNTVIKDPRVANSQKCLRVSGKHNDLEEVGHDTYHHTMFEMLGNWSFGDYFKEEAISWAWELLTDVYKLEKDRLYVTIFEGANDDDLEVDSEAKNIWLKYVPEDRIILGNKKDNFWEMGDMGPCGPCSEIHIDLRDDKERAEVSGASLVNKDHHLVVEIWNLVFIQFNRKANGSLELLPNKHVDTGMGLERLVMAINKLKSNYEGDLFVSLIRKVSELSGIKYGENKDVDVAMRVISDHIRAISFSIADGQLPSNVKAGYVIRRILRRAVRYGYTFLDFTTPFLCNLVPTLVKEMGEAFPELVSQQQLISKVIKEEEEAFLRTLAKGIKLMNDVMEKSKATKMISGIDTFTLYDTFGFPLDLSELIAKENGYTIDIASFEEELNKQKTRARNAASVEQGDWEEIKALSECEFIGYDYCEAEISICKYRSVRSKNVQYYQLVFDKTPFYAESGGQMGDSGFIITKEGEKIEIVNTVKENNLIIHVTNRLPIDINEPFKVEIDKVKRSYITNNHTATHLLHNALRSILGDHIEQKGSSVNAGYFRFDFSHFEKIPTELLRTVERRVNDMIRENRVQDEHRGIHIEKAQEMGAIALFGEKYSDQVRVIKFGDSIELCGGTHAKHTGEIGLFKIISESAVAAGIRRIEACTGHHAEMMVEANEDQISTIKSLFGSPDIVASLKKLLQENEQFKENMQQINKERVNSLKASLLEESMVDNGIRVINVRGSFTPDVIKDVAFQIYNEIEDPTVFAAGIETPDGKINLTLMYSKSLVDRGFDASKDIREAAKFVNGGGGGQKFLATAGGKLKDGIPQAVEFMINNVTKG